MDRPVTEEGLQKQIMLMTQTMFEAVEKGDKDLFAMAILKGADVTQRNHAGLALLHAGVKRAVRDERLDWLLLILPHVDDLFVTTNKGCTLFDAGIDPFLVPHSHPDYVAMLRKCREHVMKDMPDMEAARQRLQNKGLSESRVLIAPAFKAVASPVKLLDKRATDRPTPPDKPDGPAL